jgi:hypothetical protein
MKQRDINGLLIGIVIGLLITSCIRSFRISDLQHRVTALEQRQ